MNTLRKRWFRILGYGFKWTCDPPLFGERNGYQRPIIRIGKWRVFFIGRL